MEKPPAPRTDEIRQPASDTAEQPLPSVVGDAEDAVAPEVEGELTPWTPRGPDAGDDADGG